MARERVKREEVAKLEIICNDAHECSVSFTGDRMAMLAAFTQLLDDDSSTNVVHDLITGAISIVTLMQKKKEKKKEE